VETWAEIIHEFIQAVKKYTSDKKSKPKDMQKKFINEEQVLANSFAKKHYLAFFFSYDSAS